MNILSDLTGALGPGAQALSAAAPVLLHRADGIWRVSGSFVDLFGVQLRNGAASGRRHFLCRLTEFMPLLGLQLPMQDGDWSILAVGGLGAGLVPVVPDDQAAAAIDAWIAGLEAQFPEPQTHWGEKIQAAQGSVTLQPGMALGPASAGLLWARVQHGLLRAADAATLSPDAGFLPIMRAWRAEAETLVLLQRTGALEEPMLRQALAAWHRAILRRIEGLAAARQAAQSERRATTARLSQGLLSAGLFRLAGRAGPPEQAVVSDVADFRAIARVAGAIGQTVGGAPLGPHCLPAGPARIDALIEDSGLRGRRVLLRGHWWRCRPGPLVGMRQEDGAAVALLPGRSGRMTAWVPGTAPVRIDASAAAALSATAWMLYRTLPDTAPGPRGLLAFAFAGGAGAAIRLLPVSLAASLLGLGVPLASGLLVEDVIPASATGDIKVLGLGLASAALGGAAMNIVRAILILQLESRLDLNSQPALFDRMLRLPPGFFKRFAAGDLADRVMGVQEMRTELTGNSLAGLFAGLLSVVNLAVMLGCNAGLAAAGLAIALTQAASAAGLAWLQLRRERRFAERRGDAESFTLQCVSGIAKLKAAGAADRAFGLWACRFAAQRDAFLSARRLQALQGVAESLLLPLGTAMLFLLAARYALGAQPSLRIGAWVAFSAAFGQLTAGLTGMVDAATGMLSVLPLYERARPLLEARPETAQPARQPGTLAGAIEFSGVTFSYGPGLPAVLHGLSFSIRPGEFVAIVGPSGCGKSTVLRLMLAYETPQAGEILFDGTSLATLDAVSVRRQIGVVLQNGRVQPGNLIENIGGGRPIALEDAWHAARLAGLEADIRALPMGMHTMLTDGGATLSGGQRQRLMIARALARRPRILLLDEATSALDNRTQSIVTEAVAGLGLTRIVIAHRLSTIEKVDRVLVLDGGRLVQSGGFDELSARPGLFQDLARRQLG
jgi:NHLM bacteriocin system ABC transporter ATP-binding protein